MDFCNVKGSEHTHTHTVIITNELAAFAWFELIFDLLFSPKGEWADPGATAIPGQPVAKVEQAPDTSPRFKNQFNIEAPI